MVSSKCRFCGNSLTFSFADLGKTPLANSFLQKAQLNKMEPFYPLHAFVCEQCFLVQLKDFEKPENIFTKYAYYSSYSNSWLDHARKYAEQMVVRYCFDQTSTVIEIASNDGYLLQYFKEKGIPVLGIDPAENVADVAIQKGIETKTLFFSIDTAKQLVKEGYKADLLIGNNVLAHVPDLNSFLVGMKLLLKKDGIITMEFPHLLSLIQQNQFDTIYHEHLSYFSFITVQTIFKAYGFKIFDVEILPTHGGSLRIYGTHDQNEKYDITFNVTKLVTKETTFGLESLEVYKTFHEQVKETKRALLETFIQIKRKGQTIAGFGAPAKGNTLLNYCGIGRDFIDYTVDETPFKQGLFLPGSHIPIHPFKKLQETKPDYLFILPWNWKDEIMKKTLFIREWGGKYIVPIPNVQII